MEKRITPEELSGFRAYLIAQERSEGTIEKYIRDLTGLARWLAGREVCGELMTQWKAYLCQCYAPVTVNAILSAANTFFNFVGWSDCRLKFLKIQRKLFRESSRQLTREEYIRLLASSRQQGSERLPLLLETMGSTGVRVSEVRYITVEAAYTGRVEISMKGKIRTVLLPEKLCRKLLKYAKKQKITSGEIFLTRSGKSMSRGQIWAQMKALCAVANVAPTKVFPHNLRHLFAVTFYKSCRDIAGLASVLGHSSIETTRIYLLTDSAQYRRRLNALGLIL